MDRAFAAQHPRLVVPRPEAWLRAASRILRRARLRRRLALGLGLLAVLAGGWVAVRDSPLVSVDHVVIRGVHGADAARVRAALTAAARRQHTLHVDAGALLAAVAPLHVVSTLHISTQFPHGMQITVVERLPVATLVAGDARTAVAADGTVLGAALASSVTPQLGAPALPAARVSDPRTLALLAVLGAAPSPLAHRILRIGSQASGIAVTMRNGPQILFGDGSRPHAKWASAARVLADPGSAGAAYIDVRMPDRPAAGGLSVSAADTTAPTTGLDPTAAALAAGLTAAQGGTASAATAAAAANAPAGASPGTTSTATSAGAPSALGASGAGSPTVSSGAATATPGAASGTAASTPAGGAAAAPSAAGQPYTSTGG